MTEEIIIDGVNVAGCEYYHKVDSICDNENNHNVGCGQYDTCTYKQLKRLEQENKDLKKQIESDKGLITVGGKQQYEYLQRVDELEQENKELKETKGRCAFKCLDNTFCDEARIKIDQLELDKDCLNASLETARKYRGIAEVERDNYRSALEEIRTVINQSCDKCKYNKDGITCCIGDCGEGKLKIIENKINKVLNS